MATNSYDDFLWHQTSLGRWERNIDEIEQFYTSFAKLYEGTGRSMFAVTGYISLSVAVPKYSSVQEAERQLEQALRRAWIQIRHDHPTIASWVEYDPKSKTCKKIYEGVQQGLEVFRLDEWLDETFRVVKTGMSGTEWCNADPPCPKRPTVYIITPTGTSSSSTGDRTIHRDIVFRSHHNIMDGIGTLHVLCNLLTYASKAYFQRIPYQEPKWGGEWTELSPSFHKAASLPSALTPEQEERIEETVAYNASLRQNVGIASVPFKRGTVIPGKHQRIAIALSAEQTSRLLTACKRMGITPTHAYHAAIAIRLRDLQERRENERVVRYINYCLINERGNCSEPYCTPQHAVSCYHSVSGKALSVDLAVPSKGDEINEAKRNEEFTRVVMEMKEFYTEVRDGPNHTAMVPSYWRQVMQLIPPVDFTVADMSQTVPTPNQTPSVSLSSLGLIDNIIPSEIGAFSLDSPWVTGDELGTGLGLYLFTYKGQLNLSAAFNESWHDEEEVVGFLKGVEGIVGHGLGLTSDSCKSQ